MAERIDIVIPAYNAQKTLFRALSSVAMQTVKDRLRVTVVDDGSEGGYEDILARFDGILDARLVRQENAGPGAARQRGIDETDGELLMFLDADDVFNGPFAIEELLKDLPKKAPAVFGHFLEQAIGNTYVMHDNREMVWMFAAVYRRKFLEKHNIRMVTSRLSEDTAFNVLMKLYGGYDIVFSTFPAVCWMFTEGSITRNDIENYDYGVGMEGHIDAVRLAFEHADKVGGFNRALGDELRAYYLCRYYGAVLRSAQQYPEGEAANMRAVGRFYKSVILPAAERLTGEMLNRQFGLAAGSLNQFLIPGVTFEDWIKRVAKEAENGAD